MFWAKKKIASDEYADLLGKITNLRQDLEMCKATVANCEQQMQSLRGVVNRKLASAEKSSEGDVPDGSVVLTKEELDELQKALIAAGVGGKI